MVEPCLQIMFQHLRQQHVISMHNGPSLTMWIATQVQYLTKIRVVCDCDYMLITKSRWSGDSKKYVCLQVELPPANLSATRGGGVTLSFYC